MGLSGADPTQRGDRLQAWTAVFNAGQFNIYSASRTVPTGVFGAQVDETGINDVGSSDQDPSVTADGLRMLFVSNRTGGYLLYEASRATPDVLFGAAVQAAGLDAPLAIGSIDLLPDGLTVYMDLNFSGDLYRSHRPALTAPFDAPVVVAPGCAGFPSVSTDELELFYVRSNLMYTRSRATTADSFGPETLMTLVANPGDPEVSADGTELWFTDSLAPVRATRTCQ